MSRCARSDAFATVKDLAGRPCVVPRLRDRIGGSCLRCWIEAPPTPPMLVSDLNQIDGESAATLSRWWHHGGGCCRFPACLHSLQRCHGTPVALTLLWLCHTIFLPSEVVFVEVRQRHVHITYLGTPQVVPPRARPPALHQLSAPRKSCEQ